MKALETDEAPACPLCTNVLRVHDYLLSPDELIIFDSLVVKAISFHYKRFFYSQKRIEKETRVKRTRYEAIIKKFEEMGFLQTYVDKMPNSEGQIRYFYVNFQKLTEEEVLTKLVREKSTLFGAMRAYMEYHADEEFKALCPSAVKEKPKKNQEEKIMPLVTSKEMFEKACNKYALMVIYRCKDKV